MVRFHAPTPKRRNVGVFECLLAAGVIVLGVITVGFGNQVNVQADQIHVAGIVHKWDAALHEQNVARIEQLAMELAAAKAAAKVAAPPPPARPDYSAMKMATVELSFSLKDYKGQTLYGHGSGVILSPNFILTVAHVGTASDTGVEEVLFADGSKGRAKLLWADPSRDVAIMVLAKATKLGAPRLATVPVTTGQEIWSAGYPMSLPLSVQHGEIVSDVISKIKMDDGNVSTAAIYVNITMFHGDSGGPIFNAAGEIVGLCDFGIDGSGFGGIVAMQAILADVRAVTGIS